MGYYSSLSGSITVSPAPEMASYNPEFIKWSMECVFVNFGIHSGTVTIESCGGSEHKHYYISDALQAIVNQLGSQRKYEGYFELMGEDGEQWRLAVVDGQVKEFRPTITWPAEVS